MTYTDKSLDISSNRQLYQTKRILENQKTPPSPAVIVNEDNRKQPNVSKGETGGPKGPDPTRYGDWESNGRCIDF
jgi:hypothetical protein